MLGEGMGIPAIARELDYPYYAVRDYVTRHVPTKKPSEDTCPAGREDYEIPETVNWTVTESPHPASVPELPDDTFNPLGEDIQATEMRKKPGYLESAMNACADKCVDQIKVNLAQAIQDSGERHTFDTGAVRDMAAGKGAPAYMPADALMRLSVHYENGAIKYGVGNYLLGINVSSFLNSAIRHLWKYMAGQDDEDHLAAAAFNILGMMQMEATKPELVDMAAREGKRSFVYGRFE